MTRQEHLDWCKKRSLAYVDAGQTQEGFNSMMSDLCKHDELRDHIGIGLGMRLLLGGMMKSASEVRRFIEGFN